MLHSYDKQKNIVAGALHGCGKQIFTVLHMKLFSNCSFLHRLNNYLFFALRANINFASGAGKTIATRARNIKI